MKRIAILLILTIEVLAGYSQQVTGFVTDSATGESLVGAHVCFRQEQQGTITNAFGYFSLPFNDTDSLSISYIGYKTKYLKIDNCKKEPIAIQLSSMINLDEVVVTDYMSIQNSAKASSISLSPSEIQILPALAGETDVLKAFQLMPGIKSAGEGQSSFFVRGGSPDQNMIILDNVPIYYINHLGGFVSVFNTEAIKDAKIYKGGFPAQYGGRLSSIVDIKTKDGNSHEHHTSLTLGLVSSKIMHEGPLKNDTLTYFISGRRFMYDLITRPLTYLSNDKNQTGYTFYDLNAKLRFKPNNKNRFYWSFYSGYDKMLTKRKLREEEKSKMKNVAKWGNLASSIRWNHLYGEKLFSNITAYYMRYSYNSDFEYSYNSTAGKIEKMAAFSSGISDIALKSDFEYYPLSNLFVVFGSNSIAHMYIPHNYTYDQPTNELTNDDAISQNHKQTHKAIENEVKAEAGSEPLHVLSFRLGYRFGTFSSGSRTFLSHEPRAIFNLKILKTLTFKASYAKMSQNVHLLTYMGTGIPADLWMPSVESVPPQQSQIFSLGLHKYLTQSNIEISLEAYGKRMKHLIEYRPGTNLFNEQKQWTESVEKQGTGISKGVELLIRKKSGRVTGWLSYTLSETTRKFENFNQGKKYPYTYDATHDFSLVCNYRIKERWTLSATWSYVTGRAITLANEYYDTPIFSIEYGFDGNPGVNYVTADTYEHKNDVRMNPYHRLDVGFEFKKYKKKSERIIKFGVYNLYNKQNAIYYYVVSGEEVDEQGEPTGNSTRTLYQMSMFPFLPYISYTWLW
jgi:hypothetical protein